MGTSKQAKTLFEMYNQNFDGTVNSVVDTGLKLWDGTHNRWKMEVVYDAITSPYESYITLFTVRPDAAPYSGIRVRKDKALSSRSEFTLTVGEACTVISNPGEFSFGTNIYGSHLYIGNTNSVNSFTLIRDGKYLYCDYNGQTATLRITDPKTNNLNLLIGCDYKGANNETQRYYTGTVQKFVISELGDIPFDEIEYLESTGTQYIDTGLVHQVSNYEYYIDFTPKQNENSTAVLGSSNNGYWDGISYNNRLYIGNRGQGTGFYREANIRQTTRMVVVDNHVTVYKNGNITSDIDFTGSIISGRHILLYAYTFGSDDGRGMSAQKVYSFTIIMNGVKVLDFIPVRIGQTGYMYDKVSGQLFGNSGTGDFVLGPDKT